MLKLDVRSKRTLTFDVEIEGVDYTALTSSLRFNIDTIEYGFSGEVTSGKIEIVIPPLNEVIKRPLKNEEIVKCKLEVFGDGFYLMPWEGEFEIESPVNVKVKLKENKPKPKVTAKISEVKLVDKKGKLIPDKIDKKTIKKLVKQKVKQKLLKSRKILEKKRKEKPQQKRKSLPIPIKKEMNKKEIKSTEDLYTLMESMGMKNKKIQNIMLEKAKEKSGDDLQSTFENLQIILGIKKVDEYNMEKQFKQIEKLINKE